MRWYEQMRGKICFVCVFLLDAALKIEMYTLLITLYISYWEKSIQMLQETPLFQTSKYPNLWPFIVQTQP